MPTMRRKVKRTSKKADKENKDEDSSDAEDAAQLEVDAKQKAAEFKAEGNTAFSAGQWEVALFKFTEAIKLDPTDHVFFSNRSASNLQLKRTTDAVCDGRECVRLSPTWAKGYSRLGAALLADKQPIESQEVYEKGLRIEPTNAALLEGLASAKPAAEEERKRIVKEEVEEKAKNAPVAPPTPEESTVIGIDLGTTFSCVAVWRDGGVEILSDESGSKTTPSFVTFTEDGGRAVGNVAKEQAAKNTKNTFYDIKRIIGQKWAEPAVREEVKRFPFEVVADEASGDPRIVVDALGGKQLPPEQISGLVLSHMKRIAETNLGHPVKKAVVTVPAYFNDAQRQATKAAGAIAGLDVLRIINEPTAAALAYGLDNKGESVTSKGSNIMIYDLGGGTFDVSVLRIEEGMFTVKATGGDTHLGGEDFDNTIVQHCIGVLKKDHGIEVAGDPKKMRKLQTQVEKAKRTLSSGSVAQVEVEEVSIELTRALFEKLNKDPFDRTLDTVKKVLSDAKMQPEDIDDIVLIGGSTRIPKVQDMLSGHFGGRQLCRSINPDEAVAYGAAVQGAILSGVRHAATQSLLLVDVTPLSLGIELHGKVFSILIPRNTSIPCKKSHEYTTVENYQPAIDIAVYEGERPCTDGNRRLGEFKIENIERAKKGEPKIDVQFALDANGILDVTAKDKKTGAIADCRIEGACKGLDPREIEKMVKEAEKFASEDVEYRAQLELKTELEGILYDIQERDESSGDVKKDLLQKAQECSEWLECQQKLGAPEVGRTLKGWLRKFRD